MKTENQQKIQQKVKKHMRNNLTFILGAIGSLGVLSFGVIESWQTFRQAPIPQHLEFINHGFINNELKSLVINLDNLSNTFLKCFQKQFICIYGDL